MKRYLSHLLPVLALAVSTPAAVRAQQAEPDGAPAGPVLTRPPELLEFVTADYPPDEQALGREASVLLEITLSETGAVTDVTIVESAGEAFDLAALTAVGQFVFSPAEVDGQPSAIRIQYRYDFVLEREVPTTAEFVGIVRERVGDAPLEGITVTLDDGRSAVTDAEGRFAFVELTPGARTITLEGPNLAMLRTEETLEAGVRLDAIYEVDTFDPESDEEFDDFELVVRAPALQRQATSVAVDADDARRVPGTQGDVVRVVDNMPGVARSGAGSSRLVVWGAAPEETRVYLDGIRLPRLYHEGGVRSVVHSDLVGSVELMPGGQGAMYGRGLGGVVEIASADILEPDNGVGVVLAADPFDASASLRVPLGDDVRVAVAGRYGVLDRIAAPWMDADAEALVSIPEYYDGQLRLAWAPVPAGRLEIGGLVSADRTSRGRPDPDPARQVDESRELGFWRTFVRYREDRADGTRFSITPWVGGDADDQRTEVGIIENRLRADALVGGLRADWSRSVSEWATVHAGIDVEVESTDFDRRGSIGLPAREGDLRVFGRRPPDVVSADQYSVTLFGVAPWLAADLELGQSGITVSPGLRVDPSMRSVSRRTPQEGATPAIGLFAEEFAVEPRLRIEWLISDAVSLQAATGRYRQAPQGADLSAAFGTPTLEGSRAWHGLLGATFVPWTGGTIETTVFARAADRLSVRSASENPALAEVLEASGTGRTVGGQVLVRHEVGESFVGWLSYSLSRSERRRPGTEWRLFDYDQPHVLSAVASWKPGLGFDVGGRFRVSSGFPRTPVIDAYFDAMSDAWEPIFGAHNSERLPLFCQLDLRASREFTLASSRLELWLEVQNVTNRSNAEEVAYSADYAERGYLSGLPILPMVGIRWEY